MYPLITVIGVPLEGFIIAMNADCYLIQSEMVYECFIGVFESLPYVGFLIEPLPQEAYLLHTDLPMLPSLLCHKRSVPLDPLLQLVDHFKTHV